MTTISATCVSSGPILVTTDSCIYSICDGMPFELPTGAVLTELYARRVNQTDDLTDIFLTADRSVIVGIPGDPILFTGTLGVLTNDLNTDCFATILDKPVTEITRFPAKTPTKVVIRSGLLGDITEGEVLFEIKYKMFPARTPITGDGGRGNLRTYL